MNRIFCDMDGVLADFAALKRSLGIEGDVLKKMPRAYADLKPIPGALDGVRSLIGMGFEVWIATKPPTGIAQAYADKAQWVLDHLPELKRNIIVTHDKGLLGDEFDYLIDDRPHKANCSRFRGSLYVFLNAAASWERVLDYFREERDCWDKAMP